MSAGTRLLLAILLGIAVLTAGTGAAAAYAWHQAGTFRLSVHDAGGEGSNLSMSLPGALVDAVITLCPVPEGLGPDGVRSRLDGFEPLLRTVAEEIGRMPDAVIVDVRDGRDRVRITKQGDEILVRVVSDVERVEIDLPVRSFRHALEKFSRIAARSSRA
jgi:hypothetical protein